MRILLIRPPVENSIDIPIPEYVKEEQGIYPPLGIMYLATCIEKQSQHEVDVIDAEAEKLDYKRLEKKIRKADPDVVGIQTLTFNLIDALNTAKITKNVNEEIKVVTGGPHVDIYPYETVKQPFIDFIILGEGEESFLELVDALSKGSDLRGIKGLVYKKRGKIIKNECSGIINDINSIPFPARHMVPVRMYSSIFSNKNFTTMITSRGCPYNCTFCYNPWKKVRMRKPENVVDEMEECNNLGIKDVFIFDDTFTIDKKRTIEICKDLKKRGVDLEFAVRTRVDRVDREIIENLKSAGCKRIQYGIESHSQKVLNILRKRITIEQIKDAVNLSKQHDILTYGDFLIGCPTQKKEDVMKTIDFAKSLGLDFAQFSILMPLPNTKLYSMGIEMRIFNDYWREFASNPSRDFIPKFWEETFSREELIALLHLAYRNFYIKNPRYILKRMRSPDFYLKLKSNLSLGFKILSHS